MSSLAPSASQAAVAPPSEWDSPVTRLALLLELAAEPDWLLAAVAERGGMTAELREVELSAGD